MEYRRYVCKIRSNLYERYREYTSQKLFIKFSSVYVRGDLFKDIFCNHIAQWVFFGGAKERALNGNTREINNSRQSRSLDKEKDNLILNVLSYQVILRNQAQAGTYITRNLQRYRMTSIYTLRVSTSKFIKLYAEL